MALARMFIALPIVAPPELRRVLAELAAVGPPVRVTPEANLHLTLAFLGNVDTACIEPLTEAMRQAAASVRPFPAELRGLGAFPSRTRPRIVWSGFDATSATTLTELAAAVVRWLDAADLAPPPEDRPWRPHLTLARIGGRRGRPAAMHELPRALGRAFDAHHHAAFGVIHLRDIHLMQSTNTGREPVYTSLAKVALK